MRGCELSTRYLQLRAGAVRGDIEVYSLFVGLRASDVTPGAVDRWMLWLNDHGRSARTVNIALQAMLVGVRD